MYGGWPAGTGRRRRADPADGAADVPGRRPPGPRDRRRHGRRHDRHASRCAHRRFGDRRLSPHRFASARSSRAPTATPSTSRPMKRDFWSFMGDSRVVHISAPPETRVVIANAGNINVTGLRADATVTSGAHFHPGDGISVRDFRGSLTATSPDGTIDVTDADCPQLHAHVVERAPHADAGTRAADRRVEQQRTRRGHGLAVARRQRREFQRPRVAGFRRRAPTRRSRPAQPTGACGVSGFAATAATYVTRRMMMKMTTTTRRRRRRCASARAAGGSTCVPATVVSISVRKAKAAWTTTSSRSSVSSVSSDCRWSVGSRAA